MEREKIFKKLSEYKKHLESLGLDVIYIGLYGSQNYNVDDEESDIDARAIIMPSLHDIVFRKVTSKVIEFDNGAVDVKDLITYYDVIKKGNFSFIEAIDTEYSLGDKYIKELFSKFRPNLKSILGAMHEKRKALTHMYPSKVKEFEMWGCDPKQYHHIQRLLDILNHNTTKNQQVSYLKYDDWQAAHMIGLKRNKYGLLKHEMEARSDFCIDEAKMLIPIDYEYKPINIDEEIGNYIKKELKKTLYKTPVHSAREVRTFNNPIPKDDLKKFAILKDFQGQDISYIVYESIDIL